MSRQVKQFICDKGQMVDCESRLPTSVVRFVGVEDYDALGHKVEELEHQQRLLVGALAACITAAGIVNPETPLTGPQLLLLAEDLKSDIERQHSVAIHDAAKHQVIGYSVGRRHDAVELIGGMNLTIEGWQQIKAECPWMNPLIVAEIDEAFLAQAENEASPSHAE